MQLLLSIILFSSFSFSKPDPKAKAIMDKVHEVYEKAGSLDMSFSYQQSNSDIVGLIKKGQLQAKGEMYKLILEEIEIYSDGKTQYTYLKKIKKYRSQLQMTRRINTIQNILQIFINPVLTTIPFLRKLKKLEILL